MGITSRILAQRGKRQASEQGLDPTRIPPGQYLTARFPVLTAGPNPDYDLSDWDLRIWGDVERPYSLTWDELQALEQTTVTVDIHCVTRWSKLDTTWTGVKVSTLLERAGVAPEARYLMAHSDGGYTTNMRLDVVMADDVLVAHTYDGKPLEHDHGAPLRLLVPSRYFWKSAKFLRSLEVMTQERQGYWELNGYHDDARPFEEERHWF